MINETLIILTKKEYKIYLKVTNQIYNTKIKFN